MVKSKHFISISVGKKSHRKEAVNHWRVIENEASEIDNSFLFLAFHSDLALHKLSPCLDRVKVAKTVNVRLGSESKDSDCSHGTKDASFVNVQRGDSRPYEYVRVASARKIQLWNYPLTKSPFKSPRFTRDSRFRKWPWKRTKWVEYNGGESRGIFLPPFHYYLWSKLFHNLESFRPRSLL